MPAELTPRLLNRLRMRQVALLLALEEHGTLHAAANALGLTQPGASKMLHELEDAVGQPLLERVGRGLRWTASGLCVLRYFRGLQGNMESMGRQLQELQLGSAGKLFIGCIMAASPELVSKTIIQLRIRFPLLGVEIAVGTSDWLMHKLQEGSLDLVIGRVVNLAGGRYSFRPIGDEALSVVAAVKHPLARRKSLNFDALLPFPWIVQINGSPMRDVLEQEFRIHHQPKPLGLVETSSILMTTSLLAQTEMIAVIPQSIASRYQSHGLLRILPYRLKTRLADYGSIVCTDRPASMAAATFLDLLHAGEAQESA